MLENMAKQYINILDEKKYVHFLDSLGKSVMLLGANKPNNVGIIRQKNIFFENIITNLDNKSNYENINNLSTINGFFNNLMYFNKDKALKNNEYIIGAFGSINLQEKFISKPNLTKKWIYNIKNLNFITTKLNYFKCEINYDLNKKTFNEKYFLSPLKINNFELTNQQISNISNLFNKIKLNFKKINPLFNNLCNTENYTKYSFLDYNLLELYYKKLEYNNLSKNYMYSIYVVPCKDIKYRNNCCGNCLINKENKLKSNIDKLIKIYTEKYTKGLYPNDIHTYELNKNFEKISNSIINNRNTSNNNNNNSKIKELSELLIKYNNENEILKQKQSKIEIDNLIPIIESHKKELDKILNKYKPELYTIIEEKDYQLKENSNSEDLQIIENNEINSEQENTSKTTFEYIISKFI